MKPQTIAVIGGGPAGATAAEKLAEGRAARGLTGGAYRVLVFEEKIGWEKPCGGGLSFKALRHYPFLEAAASGGNMLSYAEFTASGAAMRFHLRSPLAVYSRARLNQLLLHRAEQAGAEIVADKILDLRRRHGGWDVVGRERAYQADYVVLAAGARTRLRRILAPDFAARDFMLTFGYYLHGPRDVLRVEFYQDFEGYAWAFPRLDHVSVGICGKVGEDSMPELRGRLNAFMREHDYLPDSRRIFSHLLPSLQVESWGALRLAGQGWALAGDAAGLVDSVTGEGIYYAMRSGELLAEALLDDFPEDYPERVRNEFGRALTLGARLAKTFYHGEFMGGSVTTRMIEFGSRSRQFRGVIQDLVEGSQSYPGLAARLHVALACTLLESGAGRLRNIFRSPELLEG